MESEQVLTTRCNCRKKKYQGWYAGSSFPFIICVTIRPCIIHITHTHNTLLHASIVMQIPTGTTEVKRTTVPFMYNLEEDVEGLNVVDFPGVDDEDDTIGDLADLLVTIAQIIIFVVDYRCVCLVSR